MQKKEDAVMLGKNVQTNFISLIVRQGENGSRHCLKIQDFRTEF